MKLLNIALIATVFAACGSPPNVEELQQEHRRTRARKVAKVAAEPAGIEVHEESFEGATGSSFAWIEGNTYRRNLVPGTVAVTSSQAHSGSESLQLTSSYDGTTRQEAQAQVCVPSGASYFLGSFWIRHDSFWNWSYFGVYGTPQPSPYGYAIDTNVWYWTRSNGTYYVDSGTTLGGFAANTWHQVEIEYDLTTGLVRLWVDGVLRDTKTTAWWQTSGNGYGTDPRCFRWSTASRVSTQVHTQTIWIDDVRIEVR